VKVVTITVRTRSRCELVSVTNEIHGALRDLGNPSGFCHLYVPHTTAGITVNEGADPAVARDILRTLETIAPPDAGYQHLEGNADAHVKAALVGSSLVLPVEEGRLLLGRWQTVFLCEFDGPRSRRLEVRVLTCLR
jgi:secondary thiamine-phosphate synthase enzyme